MRIEKSLFLSPEHEQNGYELPFRKFIFPSLDFPRRLVGMSLRFGQSQC